MWIRNEQQGLHRFPGPPGHRRLRQHRPGRAAADPAPYRHPSRPHHHRHGRRRRHERGRGARRAFHPRAAGARELPPRARRGDGPGRFPAEPVGRRVEHRADQVLLGTRRDVPRHLHRALGRRLHRQRAAGRARARTTRCARRRWRCARRRTPRRRRRCSRMAPTPAWSRISSRRRCCSWPPI